MEITPVEETSLRHLQSCMESYEYGTKEHKLARALYASLCSRIRARGKILEIEKDNFVDYGT